MENGSLQRAIVVARCLRPGEFDEKVKKKRGDPDGGQPLNSSGKERSAKESGGLLLGIGFH